MTVSAIRNEDIVTERATIPLISIENGFPFFSETFLCIFELFDRFGTLYSFTNLAINNVTKIAKGIIAIKVACQPKVWIMLAPTNSPTTEPLNMQNQKPLQYYR